MKLKLFYKNKIINVKPELNINYMSLPHTLSKDAYKIFAILIYTVSQKTTLM